MHSGLWESLSPDGTSPFQHFIRIRCRLRLSNPSLRFDAEEGIGETSWQALHAKYHDNANRKRSYFVQSSVLQPIRVDP